MKVLITGSAGFLGAALVELLLSRGDQVVGIDNHNDYYNVKLKEKRLKRSINHPNYVHLRMDIENTQEMKVLFIKFRFDRVVHLAAQAGVRYSIEEPLRYINSNIVGFINILEGCRNHSIQHLVYASSSSVYGANTTIPYSIKDNANHPLSLYAATKKSNELFAHTYSHLFGIPTTGLRFFTVYGPWSRPDMAMIKFAKAIHEGKSIKVFNNGLHCRDFTYISDAINAVVLTLDNATKPNYDWDSKNPSTASSNAPWRIYNVGSNKPIKLLELIHALEFNLNRKAVIELLPLQPGDVSETHADIIELSNDLGYKPNITFPQ
jgi:UDP-glucuronate 4-epimerase